MEDLNATTIILILVILAICVFAVQRLRRQFKGESSCCGGDTGVKKPRRVRVADTDEANYPYRDDLRIGGMMCEACARNVANAMNSVEGTWARVDWEKQTAHVLSKNPIDVDALAAPVEAAGYYIVRKR